MQVTVSRWRSGIPGFCCELACKQSTFHPNVPSHLERKQLPVTVGLGENQGAPEGVSFQPVGPSLSLFSHVCDEIKNT